MATPVRFERTTARLEGECSIQLSYGVTRPRIYERPPLESKDHFSDENPRPNHDARHPNPGRVAQM